VLASVACHLRRYLFADWIQAGSYDEYISVPRGVNTLFLSQGLVTARHSTRCYPSAV
jgi:hypothetical protein